MALKATIFKADISITDMDRNYYNDHNLTIARHPSENDERMMLRIIAFIVNAHEHLQFTKVCLMTMYQISGKKTLVTK